MDFIHVDLTGYPHTTCIHLIAYSLDGRSYRLCACCCFLFACFVGLRSFYCPWYWFNGIQYLPRSYLLPMKMGILWHVMSTSSSLYTVTQSLVKVDMLPLSDLLPTLISDVGNFFNVSASAALLESCRNDSAVTYLIFKALLLSPPTFLSDILNIGRPNFFLSFSLRYCPSAP